ILNYVLDELAENYDFEQNRTLHTFQLTNGAGPYVLPSDWLRARGRRIDGSGSISSDVFFYVDGVPHYLDKIEYDEYRALILDKSIAGNGAFTVFATDMSKSPPEFHVWPPSTSAYTVIARYFKRPPQITEPENSASTPWFPNTNYLITRVAGELMKITRDDTAPLFLGDTPNMGAAWLLAQHLKSDNDQRGIPKTVKLDPRQFGRSVSRLRVTKRVGYI
ncbi:MAG: hypothetical protein C4555_05235, partial [Dehalococcoidia bacterium]